MLWHRTYSVPNISTWELSNSLADGSVSGSAIKSISNKTDFWLIRELFFTSGKVLSSYPEKRKTEGMLKGILSISGQSGLFKLIAETKNSIIVESLITGKRIPAYSTSKISTLSDISIFTETGEILLKDLFIRIQKSEKMISPKASSNEIKAFFEEILPEYDKDRVYVSDMKKVIQWYQTLSDLNLLTEPEEEKTEEKKSEE